MVKRHLMWTQYVRSTRPESFITAGFIPGNKHWIGGWTGSEAYWTFRRRQKSQTLKVEVITAVSMKMTVSWDVAPCSILEVDRRFRGAYCLHHQGDH
jgi:hypothetical protein